MIKYTKTKILILMTIGVILALSPIFNSSPKFYDNSSVKTDCSEYLELSKISGKIHIDGNSGWAAFRAAGNCTGNGTYSEPYVIEDLVIDGEGSGSCISIEDSDVYFRIENCTLYNAGGPPYADSEGIRLSNVENSQLINNNCSSNVIGLSLESSDNNTISENIVNYNSFMGIYLYYSNYNTISGNTVNSNTRFGIHTDSCIFNNISTNVVNNNQGGIYSFGCSYETISENTVNNSSDGIYVTWGSYNNVLENDVHYNTEKGLFIRDCNSIISGNNASYNGVTGIHLDGWFTWWSEGADNTIVGNIANYNHVGIRLEETTNNLISGNTANNNQIGIELTLEEYMYRSNYNYISGNTINYNSIGIYLNSSDYNTVSGNTLIGNAECIVEEGNCEGNVFENNDCGGRIPFELIILTLVIYGGVVIGLVSILLIRRKWKRRE